MAFQSTFWKKSQTRLIGILQGEIPVDERNKMMHSKLYERGCIETGVGYFNKPANSTSIMIHKLIGVDTKDCIQKIEYNLKFQNEFTVYNKYQVLDFETFQKNKFVLTLSNEESIFEVLKALRKLPPNAYKEYRTTISFCQLVDKDGRDFDLTLIKDLSADLRKVLWECFIGPNTKNSYLDDWRIQIIKSRARVHLLPKGSFNISKNDETLVVNNSHSLVYEEAIEMQNGNDFKCLA
ncbi:unnamed protein product [Wickerhamomyces anomalus]